MEPTDRAAPLKRRRRRWLIAAFVLVLVSLVSWWYWPRGDARFVGSWSVKLSDSTGTLTALGESIIVLHHNGRGTLPKRPGASFAWFVQGDRYVEGMPTTNDHVNAIISRLRQWLPTSLRPSLVIINERRIEATSVNRIELSSKDGPFTRMTLTRIPE